MNSEQQDYEQLRRLMKLKRYEQPPPRYFNDFSSKVIARIEAGEGRQPSFVMRWFERIVDVLGARPAYSGVFGAVACLGLIGVLVQMETVASSGSGGAGVDTRLLTGQPETQSSGLSAGVNASEYVSVTQSNGPAAPVRSIFDQLADLQVQRAGLFNLH